MAVSLKSPYTDAHPEVAFLLKGANKVVDAPFGLEKSQLVLFLNKRQFWASQFFDPLKKWPLTPVVYYRKGFKYVLFLYYWSRYRGFDRFVRVRLPFSVISLPKAQRIRHQVVEPQKGSSSPNRATTPASVRIARRRVRAQIQSSSRIIQGNRSTNIRPSPEIRNTGYVSLTEGNNGGYFLNGTNQGYESFRRTWSGVRTPGYGGLKARQLPVNAHSVVIRRVLADTGLYYNYIPSTGIYFNQFDKHTLKYAAPSEYAGHLPGARTRALQRLVEAANAKMEANLAQDVAQIGQTIKLIADTATRLRKALTSLKNGNIIGAGQAIWGGHRRRYHGRGPSKSGTVASNWLEFQYGWKPLLMDIEGAVNALAKLQAGTTYVQRVTASATVESAVSTVRTFQGSPSIQAGKDYVYTNTRTKFVLRFTTASPLQAFLAQTGFTNPINLLWEVLPFSFVADWFIPIGPWLESFSSWDGLSFMDGSETSFTRHTATSAISQLRSQFGQNDTHVTKYVRETVALNRTKLLSFPTQRLPTQFKNGLGSVTHAANAVALLIGAFR